MNNNKSKIHNNRRLWLSPEDISKLSTCHENGIPTKQVTTDTYDTIFDHFSSKPKTKSLTFLSLNVMVFLQEFVITCLLLTGHRAAQFEELHYRRRRLLSQHDALRDIHTVKVGDINIVTYGGIQSNRLLASLGLIWLTLVVAVVKNRSSNSKQYSIQHRFTDFVLMAILLRFLSAVLKTLTASYSSDTVYALAMVSLFLHLVTCNYEYANGRCGGNDNDDDEVADDNSRKLNQERPTFKGGMISLTSAFFATTLLASRLEEDGAVYIFVCTSVVLFALYPSARHGVTVRSRHVGKWIPIFVSGILILALIILLEPIEIFVLLIATTFIGIFVPIWKYKLQFFKIRLNGPWDIAHV